MPAPTLDDEDHDIDVDLVRSLSLTRGAAAA